MTRPTLALIVGTRPEAIKVAPVALAARVHGAFEPVVIATGQHDDLVASALATFDVAIDHRIDLGRHRSTSQAQLLGTLLPALEDTLDRVDPAVVLVQGDTASAVAGAMVGAWRQVPVVHLEAGLRSFDTANPFPEELYRRMISSIADLHLTPTAWATRNLAAEGVPAERIVCTGNTVIDAALHVERSTAVEPGSTLHSVLASGRRLVVVTVHRRENWGAPLRSVIEAVDRIVHAVPDVEVVLPVHPNPLVHDAVHAGLGGRDRIHIVEPLGYESFISHLAHATLVLSDSGGIQEEAPTFGVPVLVLRETTERPEAVHAGSAELVGTDAAHVVERAVQLLADEDARLARAAITNPFGDGTAGRRSVDAMARLLGVAPAPPASVAPLELRFHGDDGLLVEPPTAAAQA